LDETGPNNHQQAANPALARAVVRAHNWLKVLSDGTYDSVEDLAQTLDLHPKVIRKGLRLAFLAPAITADILVGRQKRGLMLGDLDEAVALSWQQQMRL
jgi:hypothetical protein